jgi:drug/metabolite transporter (DMT)-like permease
MAVVSPLAGLISALIPFAFGIGMGERPQALELIGVALALPAIWIVSSGSDAERGTGGTGLGVLAGIGFGLFFIALAQAGDAAGYWPLVSGRATTAVIVAIILGRKLSLPPADSRLAIVVIGIGDALANVFLLLAYRSGLLSLVSVLASLYPAVTVLLAVRVLKEPLARRQVLGVVLTLVAVVLIAL